MIRFYNAKKLNEHTNNINNKNLERPSFTGGALSQKGSRFCVRKLTSETIKEKQLLSLNNTSKRNKVIDELIKNRE